MNTKVLLFAVIVALALTTSVARAVQVQGVYQDDPAQCDSHPTTFFGHELGDAAVFPSDEGLQINVVNISQYFCVPDDGFPNDFLITITNNTPFSWKDLYLVVDDGVTVGNVDGAIEDTTSPGFNGAFKIDNLGLNSNLVSGDTNGNLIFDPGEAWAFGVTNFVAPASLPPNLLFGSVGHFSASSSSDAVSTASILANRIPEPATATLFVCGLAVIVAHDDRRKKGFP